jgi:hypothetical protein
MTPRPPSEARKVYNLRSPDCPADALYIGRGSIAGNPFVIGVDGTRDEVCDKYIARVEADPELKIRLVEYCRGRNLKCFCKPLRCHGDYLLEISNV